MINKKTRFYLFYIDEEGDRIDFFDGYKNDYDENPNLKINDISDGFGGLCVEVEQWKKENF